jgi:hypothetical protein
MMLEEGGMMAWACAGVAAARPLPAASGESAEFRGISAGRQQRQAAPSAR